MHNLNLQTPQGGSNIIIKQGIFKGLGKLLKDKYPQAKIAVITDSNVKKLFGAKLKKILPDADIMTVPAGEGSKSFEQAMMILKKLLGKNFTRSDVVIGFGGGMVTDLAGFTAGLYMRGMKYIAAPTTLLGMIDASIGGKTGIDFHAKNIIGTFYLAEMVFIDPDFLKSFPDPLKMPGWGEAIKYGAIWNPVILNETVILSGLPTKALAKEGAKDPQRSTQNSVLFEPLIQKCVQVKIDVAQKDFRETGLRKILNYGHTFGHAIEAATGYKISHDHAISIGMVMANTVAQKLGRQKPETGEKIKQALQSIGLPTSLPKEITVESLIGYIKKDKKRKGDKIDFVIAPELGKAEIVGIGIGRLGSLV